MRPIWVSKNGLAFAVTFLAVFGVLAASFAQPEVAVHMETHAERPTQRKRSAVSAMAAAPAAGGDEGLSASVRSFNAPVVASAMLSAAEEVAVDANVLQGPVLHRYSDLSVLVPNVRDSVAKVKVWLVGEAGVVERESEQQWPRGDTVHVQVQLTLRIPAKKHDAGVTHLRKLTDEAGGRVESFNSHVTDETAHYVDVVTRQRVQQQSLAQLEQLLQHATSVQDVLGVQREMTTITAGLESSKAQRRSLEDRAAMAVIQLAIGTLAPEEPPPPPAATWTLAQSVARAVKALGALLVWAVDALVFFVVLGTPAAVIAATILFLVRRFGGPLIAAVGSWTTLQPGPERAHA